MKVLEVMKTFFEKGCNFLSVQVENVAGDILYESSPGKKGLFFRVSFWYYRLNQGLGLVWSLEIRKEINHRHGKKRGRRTKDHSEP